MEITPAEKRPAWKRARRDYHELATGTFRFSVWVALWALGTTAATTYLTWGHKQLAQTLIAVGALAVGTGLAFGIPFVLFCATAKRRNLEDRVAALEVAAPAALTAGSDPLRVALSAVRSELAACALIIIEAREAKRWWRPEPNEDPLPGRMYSEHFAVISSPLLPEGLNLQIEIAYQKCNRLNQRIRGYLAADKESKFMVIPVVPPSAYKFRVGDDERLLEAKREIDQTNTAISKHLALNGDVE